MERILLWFLGVLGLVLCLQGCAGIPEGGSSMPWARPESWETQGRMNPGVNF